MGYRYSVNSEWGKVFGLDSTDLEEWQLKKIGFDKLVELVAKDPRAEKIIGDLLFKCDINDLDRINKLTKEELDKLPYLVSKYNECIKNRSSEIEKAKGVTYYGPRRLDYIFWHILDHRNKAKEFARWVDGKRSIIEPTKINYEWLYSNYEWIAHQVTKKILSTACGSESIIYLIENLPKNPLEQYIKQIFSFNKNIYVHTLSNIHTPKNYVVRALRDIAGRMKIPAVKVALDESTLRELPPVMRLNLFESLLVHSSLYRRRTQDIKFSGIDEECFRSLLFGTAIKYNSRVEHVVRKFTQKYGSKQGERK